MKSTEYPQDGYGMELSGSATVSGVDGLAFNHGWVQQGRQAILNLLDQDSVADMHSLATTHSDLSLGHFDEANISSSIDFESMVEQSMTCSGSYSEFLYKYDGYTDANEDIDYQEIAFEQEIDLHGCSDKASVIEKMGDLGILQSYGLRVVRLITGKGNTSKDGKSKLKGVAERELDRLVREGVVEGYDNSGTYKGGSGAIVVYLKQTLQ